MSAAEQVPVVPPQGGMVKGDVSCRKCGYNLRGLGVEGRCPECGTPVGLSLLGDLLRYSDPEWINMVRRGFSLMIGGIAVVLGSVVLLVALSTVGFDVPDFFWELLTIGGWLLYLWGTWLVTERDPSGLGEDQYGTARKLIRVGVVCSVVGQVLESAAGDRLSPELAMVVRMIGVGFAIVSVVATFAELQYLEKLASRIPDADLSRRASFLKWAIGVAMAVPVLLLALSTFAGPVRALGACVALPLALAALVFGVMYVRLLHNMKKRFAEEAAVARVTWAVGGRTDPSTTG